MEEEDQNAPITANLYDIKMAPRKQLKCHVSTSQVTTFTLQDKQYYTLLKIFFFFFNVT